MGLDPRTKLLILALTSISVFLNESFIIESGFVLIPIILLLISGKIGRAVKSGVLFIILLIIQLWLVEKLPVAAGGIVFMFAVYIRKLIPCFLLGAYLIQTTRVSTFLAAISRLRLPKGFNIALAITLRYFPTMTEEWGLIKDAMSLRGISVSLPGLLCHPMKTLEYVYVPMLVSASKISDEITMAAVTRGIDHSGRRSSLERVKFSIWDAFLVLIYIGILTLIIINLAGGGILF